MRYFELIEEKEVAAEDLASVVSGEGKKTKVIRIPAGVGPVQVYARDGKIFVISTQPLERVVVPDSPGLGR